MRRVVKLTIAAVVGAFVGVGGAQAETFDWSFDAGGVTGSGTLTTNGDLGAPGTTIVGATGAFDDLGVFGTIDTLTIVDVAPAGTDNSDNLLSAAGTLDTHGVTFDAVDGDDQTNVQANLFESITGNPDLALVGPDGPFSGAGLGDFNNLYAGFSLSIDPVPSATPLPATLPMFGAGLAGIGFLSRRCKRRAARMAAA